MAALPSAYAASLTPQKNSSGPLTMPVTFGPRCAYATLRSCAARPEIRPWMDGRIRCHYPLGDPGRNARIAADGPVSAKPAP